MGGFGVSGLVFACIVVGWAAYMVPLALRRYDEVARESSVESLPSLSRVIRRATGRADDTPQTREVEEAPVAAAPVRAPRPRITRESARIAAQRRRRVLITLLTTLVITILAASLGYAPRWSVAAPGALIAAWLVACRVQVRREYGLGRVATTAPARAGVAHARKADEEETVVLSGLDEDVDPGRPHVMLDEPLQADALEEKLAIAVPSMSTTGEALWDPLPVTLPTYVTKPRAGRTVRTIDFDQPGTWTSGHIEGETTELPGRAQTGTGDDTDEKKAVGH